MAGLSGWNFYIKETGMLVGKLDKKTNFKRGQSLRGSYSIRDHNYNPTQFDCISIFLFIYIYQEPCWHLRYDMQYERYFFQYAQPGAYDRLGPARPCRCCATPSDSFIMG